MKIYFQFLFYFLITTFSSYAKTVRFILPNYTLEEKVFLTGNSKELCFWKPDCVKLKKDGRFYTADIQTPKNLKFKVTLGSWESEGVKNSGQAYLNFTQSDTNNVIKIEHWKNQIGRFHNDMLFNDTIPAIQSGIFIVGSSSARLWKRVSEDLYPENAISLGAGGAHIEDLLQYKNRLILKHQPDILLIYAGENDLSSSESIENTKKQYLELLNKIRIYSPFIRLVCLGIKVSPVRERFKDKIIAFNNFMQSISSCEFIDLDKALRKTNGELRYDVWLPDRLHLNQKGYKLWSEVILKNI